MTETSPKASLNGFLVVLPGFRFWNLRIFLPFHPTNNAVLGSLVCVSATPGRSLPEDSAEGGGGRPAGCRGILQALPGSIPHSREVAPDVPTLQRCSAAWQAWHYYTPSTHLPARMFPRAWLFGLVTNVSIFVVALSMVCSSAIPLVCPCAPGPSVLPWERERERERWQGEQAAGSCSGSATTTEAALWVCTWRAAPLSLRFLSGKGLLKVVS